MSQRAAEYGGRRQRRGVELVEPERRADEAEQDPGADHNEDGGVGKLVELEEQHLILDAQLHGLLGQAHFLPPVPLPLLLPPTSVSSPPAEHQAGTDEAWFLSP